MKRENWFYTSIILTLCTLASYALSKAPAHSRKVAEPTDVELLSEIDATWQMELETRRLVDRPALQPRDYDDVESLDPVVRILFEQPELVSEVWWPSHERWVASAAADLTYLEYCDWVRLGAVAFTIEAWWWEEYERMVGVDASDTADGVARHRLGTHGRSLFEVIAGVEPFLREYGMSFDNAEFWHMLRLHEFAVVVSIEAGKERPSADLPAVSVIETLRLAQAGLFKEDTK